MVVKVGFLKLGNIGSATLIEFLLDERAERKDLDVRVISSGAKLSLEQGEEIVKKLLEFDPQLIILTSPNATLPAPSKVRERIKEANKPCINVSDNPGKGAIEHIESLGQGYIIVEADSMLGARREFLDPIEMAIFNSDIIKVLAVTGVFNALYTEIDKVLQQIKDKKDIKLPKIILDKHKAIAYSTLTNPYAISKAIAAYEISSKVSDLTVEACFKLKDWERYTLLASAAHEMMRYASKLADEAREMDKGSDSLRRKPHYDDGTILIKQRLIEKPRREEFVVEAKEVLNRIPLRLQKELSDKLLALLLESQNLSKIEADTQRKIVSKLREEKLDDPEVLESLILASLKAEKERFSSLLRELHCFDALKMVEGI
ncbi:MAG: F420-dependent methylenetetrahydromethanopterin dehydrogenase [Nitrososphaerales archaeon]